MWSFWKSKQTTEGFHILATAVGMICHDWCFLDPYTKGKKGKESKNEGWILQCGKNLGNPIKFLFKTLCQNMDIRAELNSKKSRLWFAFSKVTLHHSAINVHGWSWVEKNIFFFDNFPFKIHGSLVISGEKSLISIQQSKWKLLQLQNANSSICGCLSQDLPNNSKRFTGEIMRERFSMKLTWKTPVNSMVGSDEISDFVMVGTFSGANWLLVSASFSSKLPIGQRSLRQGADVRWKFWAYIYIYEYMYILKHVCISMYIYVYYICVYICLYTYIYMYVYTNICLLRYENLSLWFWSCETFQRNSFWCRQKKLFNITFRMCFWLCNHSCDG